MFELKKRYDINENGIHMTIAVDELNKAKLLHFGALPFNTDDIYHEMFEKTYQGCFNPLEIDIAGIDRPLERHGTKYIVTAPGYRLTFKSLTDTHDEIGRLVTLTEEDIPTGIETVTVYRFYDGISAVRVYNTVTNNSPDKEYTLTYISSFNYLGIEKEGMTERAEKLTLKVPHNSWQKEMVWREYTLEQLGLPCTQKKGWEHSGKAISFTNLGNWSSNEYLPMGYLHNSEAGTGIFWQIEHNGGWHWEISDQRGHLYLALSGPNEQQHHWFKTLKPGESFTAVPVCVGVATGFDEAMGQLTRYRRIIRRENDDNKKLAVIFNDYMNCLWGDPTTEKELPLIDAAAKAGCEYYCIDCGWYADGFWWDSVGEWKESRRRFPNGLKQVTDYIREKGMIPGVWLEIEVMGINSPMAKTLPDDWFFCRHGVRVYDRSRYQLDFRNPKVREYAMSVIDRLCEEYGVGYIKMDYNIEPGIGTELNADSAGDGLLNHQRAYIAWLDEVFSKHPELIIENCSSGGMRIDYAMLSRYSIQSTSDQDDYLRYAAISANAPAGLTPEQSAIWSYPLTEGDREEAVFNMVNAMTQRIHQSGHLAQLSPERFQLVKEGIDCYKSIRQDIRIALPFWPLGLADVSDDWICLGLKAENRIYLAVWHMGNGEDFKAIPIKYSLENATAKRLYPSYDESPVAVNPKSGTVTVYQQKNTARLYLINLS